MTFFKSYLSLISSVLIIAACNNNSDQKSTPAADSTAVSDSVVYEDCYEQFFKAAEPLTDSTISIIGRNGKKTTFAEYKSAEMDSRFARVGFKSLDGDTIPELITYNYTGGAHCCDEINIFSREKDGYTFKSRLYGGFVCIDPHTTLFTYSLNETLGYFFSCYACGFSDSAKGFRTIREINLKYANGKFQIVPPSDSLKAMIIKNLEILRTHGYESLGENETMDSGWRKEFAMNFAVWYYYHGKNWDETKKLFDKYYNFEDAARIWKELYSTIKEGEKESSI